jgi:hypothetical protein
VEGEQPVFGQNGEIFFRKIEANTSFLYSVREDGSGLRKAMGSPVVAIMTVPPSHKWIGLGLSPGGQTIMPVNGDPPIVTDMVPPPLYRWTGDGKHLFAIGSGNQVWAHSYVAPVAPGEALPALMTRKPPPSEAEFAKLPGVRALPDAADIVPGRTPDIYAFTRVTVQRNLYRIPLR